MDGRVGRALARYRAWGACTCLGGLLGCYDGVSVDGLDGSQTASSLSGGGREDGGSDGGGTGGGSSAGDAYGPMPFRSLTRVEYDNTVRDLLGVTSRPARTHAVPDGKGVSGFDAPGLITVSPLRGLMRAAEVSAAEGMARWHDASGCFEPDACLADMLDWLLPRAYRRPVEDDERVAYEDLYWGLRAESDPLSAEDASETVLATVLLSPDFLYRWELGGDDVAQGTPSDVPLNDFEVASRLSYFLWASTPDDALLDAAAVGGLTSAEAVEVQVARMLASPKAQGMVESFATQWMHTDGLASAVKNDLEFSSAVAAAMNEELVAFFGHVLLGDEPYLDALLTLDAYSFDERLEGLYGVASTGGAFVAIDDGRRAGLLTRLAVLTASTGPQGNSPTRRGALVRHQLMCQVIPPPPPNVDDTPPAPSPDATTRELYEQHASDPACSGCHVNMDPIGFGFEAFDAMGRTALLGADGAPIRTSGRVNGPDGEAFDFDGVIDLSEQLAVHPAVQACVPKQFFRFAMGRAELPVDEAWLERWTADFADSGGDLRALLVEIAVSSAFRHRQAFEGEMLQ